MWKTKIGFQVRRKYKALVVLYIFICLSAFFCSSLLGKLMNAYICIDVHVEGEPVVLYSRESPEAPIDVLHTYLATEEEVNALSKIPHTDFYVSRLRPVVCMTIKVKHLGRVTSLPFVEYLHIIPSPIPM